MSSNSCFCFLIVHLKMIIRKLCYLICSQICEKPFCCERKLHSNPLPRPSSSQFAMLQKNIHPAGFAVEYRKTLKKRENTDTGVHNIFSSSSPNFASDWARSLLRANFRWFEKLQSFRRDLQ